MPQITSANVACGAHAGDAETMRRTVALALDHRIAIGAHPGYRDPANFGPIARDRTVRTSDGSTISIEVDSLCIHGDTPGAPAIARAVRQALARSGIEVAAFVAP